MWFGPQGVALERRPDAARADDGGTQTASDMWWVGPPARECSSAVGPCPFVGISSESCTARLSGNRTRCAASWPSGPDSTILATADSALMRCLHVIDALRPSPITAALAALLGTRLRATGEGDVHDVLAFCGGAADEALRPRARRIFVAGAGIDIAAIVHARAYDVIHAVDAAAAHRIAPLILGSSATPFVYSGRGAGAAERADLRPRRRREPGRRRPISPSSTRRPTPADARTELGQPPRPARSRARRGWCRRRRRASRSRRCRRARRRCFANGWRAWPGRRPHERARHDRRLSLRSLSRDRRRPLRDAGRAADRNRATPAAPCGRSTIATSGASPAPASIPPSRRFVRADVPFGQPRFPAGSPVVVAGGGPGPRCRRRRSARRAGPRARRSPIPAGAAALQRHALTPDLVLVEREPGGREDAPGGESLAARQPRRAAHRTVGARSPPSSAAPASAGSRATCRRGACGRRPPSPWRCAAAPRGWSRSASTAPPTPTSAPAPTPCCPRSPLHCAADCLEVGPQSGRAGWWPVSWPNVVPIDAPGSAALTWHDVGGAALLRAEAERDLLFLAPLLPHAREALALARRARAGETVSSRDLCRAIEMLLVWGADPSIRWALQRALGLTFLPRLWRTGVSMASPQRLWRPLVLALHELVEQADRFESRLTTLAHAAPRDGDAGEPLALRDAAGSNAAGRPASNRTRQRRRPGVRRAPAPRGRHRQPRRADLRRSRDPDRPRPGAQPPAASRCARCRSRTSACCRTRARTSRR